LLRFDEKYALFMNTICNRGPARKLVEQQIATLFGRNLSLEGVLAPTAETPPPPDAEQGSLF
jgi:hypothetical protein